MLEATDLMPLDWVRLKESEKNVQITGVVFDDDAPRIIVDCECSFYDGEFEPISYTEKMLKNNGFQFIEGEYVYETGGVYNIVIYVSVPRSNILVECCGETKIHTCSQYLHDLQQVLRICGLKEFANNFKI